MYNAFLKTSLLFVLLVLSGTAMAQKKCKYSTDKVDKITGEVNRAATTYLYEPMSADYLYVDLNKSGNTYTLSIKLNMINEVNTSIAKGSEILFKLLDGTMIKCLAMSSCDPVIHATGVGVQTKFSCQYSLDSEQLKALSNSPVTAVKVSVGSEVYQQVISSKKASKFQRNAQCIQE